MYSKNQQESGGGFISSFYHGSCTFQKLQQTYKRLKTSHNPLTSIHILCYVTLQLFPWRCGKLFGPLLNLGLALWLALANTLLWKRWCTSSWPGTQKPRMFLLALCDSCFQHVNKSELACWKMRQVDQRTPITALDTWDSPTNIGKFNPHLTCNWWQTYYIAHLKPDLFRWVQPTLLACTQVVQKVDLGP